MRLVFALMLLPSLALGQQSAPYKGPEKPVRATSPCRVTRVTDGDSIECAPAGRVRMLGIDAPELSQTPFGTQLQHALVAMIPVGSTVQLEQVATS